MLPLASTACGMALLAPVTEKFFTHTCEIAAEALPAPAVARASATSTARAAARAIRRRVAAPFIDETVPRDNLAPLLRRPARSAISAASQMAVVTLLVAVRLPHALPVLAHESRPAFRDRGRREGGGGRRRCREDLIRPGRSADPIRG